MQELQLEEAAKLADAAVRQRLPFPLTLGLGLSLSLSLSLTQEPIARVVLSAPILTRHAKE